MLCNMVNFDKGSELIAISVILIFYFNQIH